MDRIPGGGYEIIDYKTNRRLPPQAAVDQDLQLSIYYLAAKEIWGIEPERLTLYYLLPGQRMTTVRTPADADELRRRIATVAERIEAGQVRAAAEPALRLVRLPGAGARCSATSTRRSEGDPAPNDDRDGGRVDRAQARGLGARTGGSRS